MAKRERGPLPPGPARRERVPGTGGAFVVDPSGRRLIDPATGHFFIHDPDAEPCCELWACCLPDGSCENLEHAECVEREGRWYPEERCEDPGFECPEEEEWACCLPDGECINTTAQDCFERCGEFTYGVRCEDPEHECYLGACCLPDYTCEQLTSAGCGCADGRFWYAGLGCDDPDVYCGPPFPCDAYCSPGTTPAAYRVTLSGVDMECCGAYGGGSRRALHDVAGSFIVGGTSSCDYWQVTPFTATLELHSGPDCGDLYGVHGGPVRARIRITDIGITLDVWGDIESPYPNIPIFSGGTAQPGGCMQPVTIENTRPPCDYDEGPSIGGGVATVVPLL